MNTLVLTIKRFILVEVEFVDVAIDGFGKTEVVFPRYGEYASAELNMLCTADREFFVAAIIEVDGEDVHSCFK